MAKNKFGKPKKEKKKPKKGALTKGRKVQRQFDAFTGLGENSLALNHGY